MAGTLPRPVAKAPRRCAGRADAQGQAGRLGVPDFDAAGRRRALGKALDASSGQALSWQG